MLAEEQSRLLANPEGSTTSLAAAMQWRLSNPEGCTSLGGNTQNCY